MLTKSRTNHDYAFTKESGSNRLTSLTYNGGSAQSFSYDEKGRLTRDDFSLVNNVEYNYQNLPVSLTANGFNYEYHYNAAGERISKVDVADTSADYYLRDYSGRTLAIYGYYSNELKSVNIQGNGLVGKIDIIDGNSEKYYYLKDHLGNIRQTIRDDGVIVSSTDYYPYGEKIREWVNGVLNRYLYSGKELDIETNTYYFGARDYLPLYGRWGTPDPLAAMRPGLSPYNYVQNDPLNRFDLLGLIDTVYTGQTPTVTVTVNEPYPDYWSKYDVENNSIRHELKDTEMIERLNSQQMATLLTDITSTVISQIPILGDMKSIYDLNQYDYSSYIDEAVGQALEKLEKEGIAATPAVKAFMKSKVLTSFLMKQNPVAPNYNYVIKFGDGADTLFYDVSRGNIIMEVFTRTIKDSTGRGLHESFVY